MGPLPAAADSLDKSQECGCALHSACDVREPQRRALMAAHPGPSHVFGDVLEGIKQPWRSRLQQVANEKLRAGKKVIQQQQTLGESVGDKAEQLQSATVPEVTGAKATRDALAQEMLADLDDILQDAQFESAAWCFKCEKACSLLPTCASGTVSKLWIEAAGVPCLAWSNMRRASLAEWLHETSLPTLAWLRWLKWSRPDCVVIECVGRFDWQTAAHWLGNGYHHTSFTFSPAELGVPSTRKRSWTLLWRADRWMVREDLLLDPKSSFMACFGRCRIADCDIYLVASEAEIEERNVEAVKAKGLCAQAIGKGSRSRMALSAADRQRLTDYEELSLQYCTELQLRQVPRGTVIDLKQNASWAGLKHSGCIGALLRKRVLWDLGSKRALLLFPEEFAIHAWPLQAPTAWGVAYARLFQACTSPEISEMLGNGMHLLACLSFVMWSLASLSSV